MKSIVKPIKINNIALKNNLFLAPMEGYTNVAFRKGLTKFQEVCGFTEMISATCLSKNSNYCKELLYRDKKEGVVMYQLFGNNVDDFVKATKNIENIADAININCGCPVDKIISQGAGCALLKRRNRIYEIIKALRKETDLALTIKIRAGYTKNEHLDYNLLYELGCDAIFIHSRTCKQKYAGTIDYNFLSEAKEKASFPIIGNGDICRFKDVKEMFDKTNVDGFMIGRAVLHNPFVFNDLQKEKDYEKWATTISEKEKVEFLSNYYKDLIIYNIKNPFIKTKTLSLFMFRYLSRAKQIRNKIIQTKTIEDLFSTLKDINGR